MTLLSRLLVASALLVLPCALPAQTVSTADFVGPPPTAQPSPPTVLLLPAPEARVGEVYSYQIISYDSPTSYGADGLPDGLRVDAANGLISGTPRSAGTYGVVLSVTNANGTGTVPLTLVVGNEFPTVDIVAKVPRTSAGSKVPAIFVIHRTGDLTAVLPVAFSIKGTAVAAKDYGWINSFVDIPAHQSHIKVKIRPSDHVDGDTPKSVRLVLESESDYRLGQDTRAKIKIIPGGD